MSPSDSTIRVAAALILDADGLMLLVRKRGTTRFMQAGGKLEPGETATAALVRELHEELGLAVPPSALEPLGRFSADAANEPGHTVESEVFRVDLAAVLPPGVAPAEALHPAAELEEVVWFDPTGPTRDDLAPLTQRYVVPLATRLVRPGMATSFGQATAAYEQGRPSYPVEAARRLVPDGARRVLDVGAGTGKFSRVLAGLVPEVVAVDPDADMLAALNRSVPGVRTVVGTGEGIPEPDASADAVTFAQSWHWVDVEAASREVARVLRPGGTLGLIWNIRDESVPWVAELSRIMHLSNAEQLISAGGPRVGEPFGALEHESWPWVRTMSVDDLVAMAASRSYVITATPARQSEIRRLVGELGESQARDGVLELPYLTHTYRATLPR